MDIICFSHLRWNFVYQRPQHLLTRFAEYFRVFYFEEPFCCAQADSYEIEVKDNVNIVTMRLRGEPNAADIYQKQQRIVNNILISYKIREYILWYYTPMALRFTADLKPVATVFDCMDELSAFMYAPPALKQLERELLAKADIVFTGGHSLYAAKKHQHPNIHSFPSSIDKKHFAKARRTQEDPEDQKNIGHPRFGFYGVIDERFDIDLIRGVADKRPDWNFIIVGPTVKIDPATLPKNSNIHYLGGKTYNELPYYLAGWDIAMISFALNESTKFISPTKTPEYLAGGKPVISTSIKDVVETYGNNGLVHIADTPEKFIAVAEKELKQKNKTKWLKEVDTFIADDSWDNTVTKMRQLIYEAIARKEMMMKKKNCRRVDLYTFFKRRSTPGCIVNIIMKENPFRSYWMAGYECADHLNCFGNRVDFVNITGDLDNINEDYRSLSLLNIKSVREGIRWSQVEKQPYKYDWSGVETMMMAAREIGIQQIWDICHFGFPDDLTPLHPMFARRFTAICVAFIEFYRSIDRDSQIIVTPINEVSFLSWLGGDVRGTVPYCTNNGWEVKYSLMRAYVEAVAAIKSMDDSIIIMPTEPLVNMVPPFNASADEILHAAKSNEGQFQVLDILSGRLCPELGGRPEFIDIIGCNYYYNNQWVANTFEFLPWANENKDPRWQSLSQLIQNVYLKYDKPVVLTETSHPGEHRPQWLSFVTEECNKLTNAGIPFWGICWYPIIDRPDWDYPEVWHHAGIWEIDHTNGQLQRFLHEPTAKLLCNSFSEPAVN